MNDEPSLSRDILESVPGWGSALCEVLDKMNDACLRLEARVAACEESIKFLVAVIEAHEHILGDVDKRVADLEVSRSNMIRDYDKELDKQDKRVASLEKAMDTIEYQAQDPEGLD